MHVGYRRVYRETTSEIVPGRREKVRETEREIHFALSDTIRQKRRGKEKAEREKLILTRTVSVRPLARVRFGVR